MPTATKPTAGNWPRRSSRTGLPRASATGRRAGCGAIPRPGTRPSWRPAYGSPAAMTCASVTPSSATALRAVHGVAARGTRVGRRIGRGTPGADTLFEVSDAGGSTGVPDGLDAALAEFARQRAALPPARRKTSPAPARRRIRGGADRVRAALCGTPVGRRGTRCHPHRHPGCPPARRRQPRGARADRRGRARGARRSRPEPRFPAQAAAGAAPLGDPRRIHESLGARASRSIRRSNPCSRTRSSRACTPPTDGGGSPTWVHDGRFRPVYVPGGVVTGRWASSGGGALQLPRQLRAAVAADPGWALIVADVAQLEPRVLAGMAGDMAMADAARGRDLYAGIVERGAVATRAEAKVAMLGAMYGATTGDSGRLMPRLRSIFPRAMSLVDDAARTGEQGGIVTTWLGRSSPAAVTGWREAQSRAGIPRRCRPTSAAPARVRATAGDSPAISSCRAPRPSGRSPGWPRSAGASTHSARSKRRSRRLAPAPRFCRHRGSLPLSRRLATPLLRCAPLNRKCWCRASGIPRSTTRHISG